MDEVEPPKISTSLAGIACARMPAMIRCHNHSASLAGSHAQSLWERSIGDKVTGVLFLVAVMVTGAGQVWADPLDQVTGTESWGSDVAEDMEQVWTEWYQSRVTLRRMSKELRQQRGTNARLAALLRRPGGPTFAQVRYALAASTKIGEGAAAREEASGGSDSATSDPPEWVKVPMERLDGQGQAIDEEGDQELRRLTKKKRPPKRER
jgi:hypothetical protein